MGCSFRPRMSARSSSISSVLSSYMRSSHCKRQVPGRAQLHEFSMHKDPVVQALQKYSRYCTYIKAHTYKCSRIYSVKCYRVDMLLTAVMSRTPCSNWAALMAGFSAICSMSPWQTHNCPKLTAQALCGLQNVRPGRPR